MSRSGYSDDCESQWSWIKWRGQVASTINGKKGQASPQAWPQPFGGTVFFDFLAFSGVAKCREMQNVT